MKHLLFPCPDVPRPLPFYLAAEEYLARNFHDGFFFIWQTDPAVIFGRNQHMETEVNLPFCRQEGIGVFRRKSGGGCVYADRGNLMVSAVTGGNDRMFVFSSFISLLALSLRKLGFDAWPSGRNDITVSGRKVSGSAFYSTGSRNIIHATLLYDSDLDRMQMAITPPESKLRAKGIASVRQRVANLSDFGRADQDTVRAELVGSFCDGETQLSPEDVRRIENIVASYLDADFIERGKIPHNHHGNTEENLFV